MRRLALLLVALLVPACAVSGPEPSIDPVEARRDLAVRAGEGDPGAIDETEASPGPSGRAKGDSDGGTDSGTGNDDGSGNGSAPANSFRRAGRIDDGTGDLPDAAPGYADATSILIEDDGSNARITVELAGALPARTADNEVIGIGVDVTQDGDEYQVFGSGEPGGWFGYLHQPGGLTRYRGTFEVTGQSAIFTVPWSALGGRGPGSFSAFVDWTGSGETGGSKASQDLAPDDGTQAFRPG